MKLCMKFSPLCALRAKNSPAHADDVGRPRRCTGLAGDQVVQPSLDHAAHAHEVLVRRLLLLFRNRLELGQGNGAQQVAQRVHEPLLIDSALRRQIPLGLLKDRAKPAVEGLLPASGVVELLKELVEPLGERADLLGVAVASLDALSAPCFQLGDAPRHPSQRPELPAHHDVHRGPEYHHRDRDDGRHFAAEHHDAAAISLHDERDVIGQRVRFRRALIPDNPAVSAGTGHSRITVLRAR